LFQENHPIYSSNDAAGIFLNTTNVDHVECNLIIWLICRIIYWYSTNTGYLLEHSQTWRSILRWM